MTDDREEYQSVEVIAQLAWETLRAWRGIIQEVPSLSWHQLPQERRDAVCAEVTWILAHPAASVHEQHDNWRAGATEDHARMEAYDSLPFSQQMKPRLFRHIVHAVVG